MCVLIGRLTGTISFRDPINLFTKIPEVCTGNNIAPLVGQLLFACVQRHRGEDTQLRLKWKLLCPLHGMPLGVSSHYMLVNGVSHTAPALHPGLKHVKPLSCTPVTPRPHTRTGVGTDTAPSVACPRHNLPLPSYLIFYFKFSTASLARVLVVLCA